VASATSNYGKPISRLQNGKLNYYALYMLYGVVFVFLLLILIFKGGILHV